MKTFKLTDLRSGLHSDTLRELAAKEMGWKFIKSDDGVGGSGKVNIYNPHGISCGEYLLHCGELTGYIFLKAEIPKFDTDLNATRSLLESLTEEEEILMHQALERICPDEQYAWQSTALEILIAYCITKSLIKLEE